MRSQEISEPQRLTVSKQLTLSLLWFALNFQSAALLPILLPAQILLFIPGTAGNPQQATFLGWLSALGGVIALVVPPIVGLISDRTTSSWGRRRPYIVLGAFLLILGALLLASAGTIVIFVAGFLIFIFGNNACTAAYQSLLPDLVPEDQRGAASGYMGLMTIFGSIGSPALAAVLIDLTSSGNAAIRKGATIYYVITGLALIICVFITITGIHEAPMAATAPPVTAAARSSRLRRWLVRNWIDPWRAHNFAWVFLSRFCVMLGLSLFMTFIAYYFANVSTDSNFVQATAIVTVLALLGAILSTLGLGMLSDRIGRIMIVCFATSCMALAALAFVVLPKSFPLWPLGILFGVGYGAYTSVDWALAIDALPSATTVGKDLGLWTIAMTLPTIVAPLLGSLVIFLTSLYSKDLELAYRLVFALAAFTLVLGAILVLRVRELPKLSSATQQPLTSRRSAGLGWRLAFQSRAGHARGFLRFWPLWERFTLFIWSVKPVPNTAHGIILIRFKRYHGRPIDLPDGLHIRSGDRVGEIHFRNQKLLEGVTRAGPWGILRMIGEDMQGLAAWSQTSEFPSGVHAITGVTLLSRGARRLGFTVYERPRTLHARLERFFLLGLMVIYHQNGLDRLLQGTTYDTYPQEVWMSRETLIRRYSKQ